MKAASPKKAKPSRSTPKVKDLSPRKDPKGGWVMLVGVKSVRQGGGGCDDDFGCSGNHNEVVVMRGRS
jgi:hypothetical protein